MFRMTAVAWACALALAMPARAADPPALQQGIQLFEQGMNAEAREALIPLGNAKPPSAVAALYLGRIALREADAKEAARWFEVAVKQVPARSEYHLWLGRAYGTQARHAGKLSQIGLARKTKAEFERASVLDPGSLDAREALMSYYLQAPGIMGGSVEKARQQADEIRKRDAFRGTMCDAEIAEDQKDIAGAERLYQMAMRAHPDSANVRHALGLLYVRAEKYDQAFATFEEALKLGADDATALYLIGRTGAVSGQRLDRAEEALRQYLEAPHADELPRPAAAHWRLGMVLEKGGKKDRARQEYERALAADPKFSEAKKSLSKLK